MIIHILETRIHSNFYSLSFNPFFVKRLTTESALVTGKTAISTSCPLSTGGRRRSQERDSQLSIFSAGPVCAVFSLLWRGGGERTRGKKARKGVVVQTRTQENGERIDSRIGKISPGRGGALEKRWMLQSGHFLQERERVTGKIHPPHWGFSS